MTPGQEKLYRTSGAVLCAGFASAGLAFLFLPHAVLALFDGWSRRLGLAGSAGEPARFYVVLAAAYMYVVTWLAWSMARDPYDAAPARLLAQAKLASCVLSFGAVLFFEPHLILLVNGFVDGAIGIAVLGLLQMAARARTERAT